MSIFIGFLVIIEVIICFLLVVSILMQPSKADSGVGSAFGGQATDAMFGANTPTVLAKFTGYLTVIFFALTFTLAILIAKQAHKPLIDPAKINLPAATDPEKPLSSVTSPPRSEKTGADDSKSTTLPDKPADSSVEKKSDPSAATGASPSPAPPTEPKSEPAKK